MLLLPQNPAMQLRATAFAIVHVAARCARSCFVTLIPTFRVCATTLIAAHVPLVRVAMRTASATYRIVVPRSIRRTIASLGFSGDRRRWTKYLLVRKFQHRMDHAVRYAQWHAAAVALDNLLGRTSWREHPESTAYDHRLIESRLAVLRQLRRSDNIHDVAYYLRSAFIRNYAGIADMRLFSSSYVGTKYLIESYLDEVVLQIAHIVHHEAPFASSPSSSSSSSCSSLSSSESVSAANQSQQETTDSTTNRHTHSTTINDTYQPQSRHIALGSNNHFSTNTYETNHHDSHHHHLHHNNNSNNNHHHNHKRQYRQSHDRFTGNNNLDVPNVLTYHDDGSSVGVGGRRISDVASSPSSSSSSSSSNNSSPSRRHPNQQIQQQQQKLWREEDEGRSLLRHDSRRSRGRTLPSNNNNNTDTNFSGQISPGTKNIVQRTPSTHVSQSLLGTSANFHILSADSDEGQQSPTAAHWNQSGQWTVQEPFGATTTGGSASSGYGGCGSCGYAVGNAAPQQQLFSQYHQHSKDSRRDYHLASVMPNNNTNNNNNINGNNMTFSFRDASPTSSVSSGLNSMTTSQLADGNELFFVDSTSSLQDSFKDSVCGLLSSDTATGIVEDGGPHLDYFSLQTKSIQDIWGTSSVGPQHDLVSRSSSPILGVDPPLGNMDDVSFTLPSYPMASTEFSAYQKLEYFHYSCQSFGCTALHLEGGTSAFFGLTHLGVVKALADRNLLPRIISGTSIGALIAALICVHTKEELPRLFERGGIDISSLRSNSNVKGVPSFQTVGLIGRIVRFLKHGYIYDISLLAKCVQDNLGDITFEEAFRRTGFVLNITVTPRRLNEVPTLLNYLTAPNVVIWSAACASAAHLGLYESIDLLAKNSDGQIVPWAPSHVDWSPDWDGHDHISPKARLAALFNVNHFIISETSPLGSMFNLYSRPQEPPHILPKLISFLVSEFELKLYQLSTLGIRRWVPVASTSYERKIKQGCISIGPSFSFAELWHFFNGRVPQKGYKSSRKSKRKAAAAAAASAAATAASAASASMSAAPTVLATAVIDNIDSVENTPDTKANTTASSATTLHTAMNSSISLPTSRMLNTANINSAGTPDTLVNSEFKEKTSKSIPMESSLEDKSYQDTDFEFISYFIFKGEQATWPYIAAIDSRTIIERTLFNACVEIKETIDLAAKTGQSPTGSLVTRTPSKLKNFSRKKNVGSTSTTALSRLRFDKSTARSAESLYHGSRTMSAINDNKRGMSPVSSNPSSPSHKPQKKSNSGSTGELTTKYQAGDSVSTGDIQKYMSTNEGLVPPNLGLSSSASTTLTSGSSLLVPSSSTFDGSIGSTTQTTGTTISTSVGLTPSSASSSNGTRPQTIDQRHYQQSSQQQRFMDSNLVNSSNSGTSSIPGRLGVNATRFISKNGADINRRPKSSGDLTMLIKLHKANSHKG